MFHLPNEQVVIDRDRRPRRKCSCGVIDFQHTFKISSNIPQISPEVRSRPTVALGRMQRWYRPIDHIVQPTV